jgi:thiamine biosynthesis lipoprotein
MPSNKSKNKPSLANSEHQLQPLAQFSFSAIGTSWWIGLYQTVNASVVTQIQAAISARIEAFDVSYSRFRKDSFITKMSQQAGSYLFPADVVQLYDFYRHLYTVTDGQVTPLVGQLLADSGYDADYSLQPTLLSPVPEWDDILTIQGRTLTASQPALLDFGAAGKGYLVDIIGELLEVRGITAYCIDAGGDIRFRHPTDSLTIGLEHPDDPELAIATIEIRNQSICASAGNRRTWHGYHHIMDPKKLASTSTIKATWAIADTTMLADGLATALFFVSSKRASNLGQFEYVVVKADNSVMFSKLFMGKLF